MSVAARPSLLGVECLARDGFDALAPAWPALLERTGHQAPFYAHELLRVWIDNFAPRAQLHVVVARDAAGPRAVLCLHERARRFHGVPARVLSGTVGFQSERFDLVAAPDDDEAIDALWEHVRDALPWDVLELPELPPRGAGGEGAAHALLARAARDVPVGKWRSKEARHVPLAGATWAGLLAARTAKFRQNLRRRRQRLAEQGPVELERVTGGLDLEARLEEGFALEASGWKGAAGTAIAGDPALRAFYAELAREAAARGWLSLYFLRCRGRAIAFHYGLADAGRYYLLKLGVDDDWRAFAPGHLLLAEVLQDLIGRGAAELDFLGPDMPWKQDWTAAARPHHWGYAFRPGLLGRSLHAAKFKVAPLLRRVLPWPR